MALSHEKMERGYQLASKGIDVAAVARCVAEMYDLDLEQLFAVGRYPTVVQARSLLCYWAVRELGVTATDLARQIGLTQPAISISVQLGEKIAKEKRLGLEALPK